MFAKDVGFVRAFGGAFGEGYVVSGTDVDSVVKSAAGAARGCSGLMVVWEWVLVEGGGGCEYWVVVCDATEGGSYANGE